MAVEVKRCSCAGTPAADFQDKTYGKGQRVMNSDAKGTSYTCTVCGAKHK